MLHAQTTSMALIRPPTYLATLTIPTHTTPIPTPALLLFPRTNNEAALAGLCFDFDWVEFFAGHPFF